MAGKDKKLRKQLEAAKRNLAGDRDQILLDHILKKDHATSHLGDVDINNKINYLTVLQLPEGKQKNHGDTRIK